MNGRYLTTDAKNRSRNDNVPDQGHSPPSSREIIRSTRLTLPDFFDTVAPTMRKAERWVIQWRWPDGAHCPHCGSPDVEEEAPQTEEAETRFRCGSCGRFFTVRTHHFTAYPPVSFRHWLLAMYLMVSEPKFRSEAQIAHFLGLDHQTTSLVIHAIHLQMMVPDPLPLESVAGVFEADEACWPKHMDSADGERFAQRLYTVLVLDRASRQVRIWVVRDRATKTMVPILARSGVGQDSTLNSDGLDVYKVAARFLLARHRWVNHTEYEYVSVDDPTVHINGAESCFAWMRHALRRIEISQENLARYVAQAEFMFNQRYVPVLDRMRELVSREHGSLTPERITAERNRFAPRTPRATQKPLPEPR